MDQSAELRKSPLHNLHVKLGARLIEFAGWSMPVMYNSIVGEHVHTRSACSLFDVSHMGRVVIEGGEAEPFLEKMCTRNLSVVKVGQSAYSHICREDGGILDDVIVSKYEKHWLVVCNASNREKILAWFEKHAAGMDVKIDDQTFNTAMVAFQGPAAMEQAQRLLRIDLSDLKRYHFKTQVFVNFPCSVFRSGYTGEDGVEVILPVMLVKLALSSIIAAAEDDNGVIKAAGLGARDVLRLEAGMPLYGHELSEDWDSLTSGQDWCVDLSKDFIGAEAMRKLKESGLERRVVGLDLEGRRAARQGYKVLAGDKVVGAVTSGAMSPTLSKSIAMALVETDHIAEGTELSVEISGKPVAAKVVKLPFYKRPKSK